MLPERDVRLRAAGWASLLIAIGLATHWNGYRESTFFALPLRPLTVDEAVALLSRSAASIRDGARPRAAIVEYDEQMATVATLDVPEYPVLEARIPQ